MKYLDWTQEEIDTFNRVIEANDVRIQVMRNHTVSS